MQCGPRQPAAHRANAHSLPGIFRCAPVVFRFERLSSRLQATPPSLSHVDPPSRLAGRVLSLPVDTDARPLAITPAPLHDSACTSGHRAKGPSLRRERLRRDPAPRVRPGGDTRTVPETRFAPGTRIDQPRPRLPLSARKPSRRRRAVLAKSLPMIRSEQKCTPVPSCLLDRTIWGRVAAVSAARHG
jgi:hypothetical protein